MDGCFQAEAIRGLAQPFTQKQLSPLAIGVRATSVQAPRTLLSEWLSAPRGVPVSMANAQCGGEQPCGEEILVVRGGVLFVMT